MSKLRQKGLLFCWCCSTISIQNVTFKQQEICQGNSILKQFDLVEFSAEKKANSIKKVEILHNVNFAVQSKHCLWIFYNLEDVMTAK